MILGFWLQLGYSLSPGSSAYNLISYIRLEREREFNLILCFPFAEATPPLWDGPFLKLWTRDANPLELLLCILDSG